MAAKVRAPQSKPVSLNKNLPLEVQVRELERYLIIAWQDRNAMKKALDDLVNTTDTEYPTDRILNLIKNKYGHTSSMPDTDGSNKDHDDRYFPKDEALTAMRRQLPLITTDGLRIYDSKKRTVLIDTHR